MENERLISTIPSGDGYITNLGAIGRRQKNCPIFLT